MSRVLSQSNEVVPGCRFYGNLKPGNSSMTTFSKQCNGNSMETVETEHSLVDVIIDFDLVFTTALFKMHII